MNKACKKRKKQSFENDIHGLLVGALIANHVKWNGKEWWTLMGGPHIGR